MRRSVADINLTGIDILRVTDGMLTEYWVNSDTLLLMQQLSPARPMSIAGVESHRPPPALNKSPTASVLSIDRRPLVQTARQGFDSAGTHVASEW
jgi:hypothetical protein